MPHTSRKKKQTQQQQLLIRNKRGEVESDDGWTRIARSGKVLNVNTLKKERECVINAFPPENANYDESLDEGCSQLIFVSTPAETPDGATLEKALSQYQKCLAILKQSNTWAELKKTFDSRILNKDLDITNCVCFGLGSPTGLIVPGHDRRNISLYQLAAFKSVIDILAEKQGQSLEAFAQDPIFSKLDIALLTHLRIKVVEHPEAFNLITLNTFAFCPGAEQFIVRGTLFRSPAMYMGSGSLETYRDLETGDIRSPHIGATFSDYDANMKDSDGYKAIDEMDCPEEDKQEYRRRDRKACEVMEEKYRVDATKGAEILHRFKKDKECFKLPDSEAYDYALYNVHLFWRSSNVKAED